MPDRSKRRPHPNRKGGEGRPRRTPRKRAGETLAADLEALRALSKEALKERWHELYDSPCPPHIRRVLLVRAIAYRMQEQALGGLDRATRRRLDRAANERGVEYRGMAWPSLSAVAREITGARWSGPRFFGLKGGPNGRG
jgi:hypothetical protein